jgi:hypothetical protein
VGEGDAGDQGVAQVHRSPLGFALGCQLGSLLGGSGIQGGDALLNQLVDQPVEVGLQCAALGRCSITADTTLVSSRITPRKVLARVPPPAIR